MRPSHFVPARDSRHRHACLALYRALIREGRRIPLPETEDVELSRRTTNPVQRLITRQYRRNRADTSPRLVFAALEAGYKFLSLFKAAQEPSSKAHAEVLSHLRNRQRERARSLAHNQNPPSTSRRKSPPSTTTTRSRASPVANPKPPPLLTRHTAPDGTTSYTPNLHPTPFERLRDGRRHIPRLFVTADGIPYLRLRKPQPVILDQVIRGKGDRLRAQVQTSKSLQEDALLTAKEEDKWEFLVRDLSRKERAALGKDMPGGRASFVLEEVSPADEKGYAAFVHEGIQYALQTMHESRRDGIARATALQKIVDEEKRLRKAETERRQAMNSATKRRTAKSRSNRGAVGSHVDSQATGQLTNGQAAQPT